MVLGHRLASAFGARSRGYALAALLVCRTAPNVSFQISSSPSSLGVSWPRSSRLGRRSRRVIFYSFRQVVG